MESDDLTASILAQERELRQIQDFRCTSLEQMVADRDVLLTEAARRLKIIEDDFSYNFEVLQSRDNEISQLHRSIQSYETTIDEVNKELERQQAINKVLVSQLKDTQEKSERDQATAKKSFSELRDVVESLKWTASEDARNKQREIDSLRDEVKRLQTSKEELLAGQRRELSLMFDNLMSQRETAFAAKEREISGQVTHLEIKVVSVADENHRLKGELDETSQKLERALDELRQRQDTIRQLEWRFDSELSLINRENDENVKRLQRDLEDVVAERDQYFQITVELKNRLDKVMIDLVVEQEGHQSADKRLESLRVSWAAQTAQIDDEARCLRDREVKLRSEMAAQQLAKELEEAKNKSLRMQMESLEQRVSAADNEAKESRSSELIAQSLLEEAKRRIENLEQEVDRVNDALASTLSQCDRQTLQHSEDLRRAVVEAQSRSDAMKAIELESLSSKFAIEIESKQREMEAVWSKRETQWESRLKQAEETLEANAIRFQLQLEAMQVENEALASEVRVQCELLNNERIETSSLKDKIHYLESVDNKYGVTSEQNQLDDLETNLTKSLYLQPIPPNIANTHMTSIINSTLKQPNIENEQLMFHELARENDRLKDTIKEMKRDSIEVLSNKRIENFNLLAQEQQRMAEIENRMDTTIRELSQLRRNEESRLELGHDLQHELSKTREGLMDRTFFGNMKSHDRRDSITSRDTPGDQELTDIENDFDLLNGLSHQHSTLSSSRKGTGLLHTYK